VVCVSMCCVGPDRAYCSINKALLLRADNFIPTLVDNLLLSPEHPRRTQAVFDAVAPPIQRVRCCWLLLQLKGRSEKLADVFVRVLRFRGLNRSVRLCLCLFRILPRQSHSSLCFPQVLYTAFCRQPRRHSRPPVLLQCIDVQ